MATIAAIHSRLTLNTSDYRKGFARAKKIAREYGRVAGRTAKAITRIGVVSGVAAAGGLAVLTRKHLESIDASAKFADSIGINVKRLSSLEHAARLSGIEQSSLHTSLERMVRTLGDVADGTGEATQAFDRIGISTRQFVGLSPSNQFIKIADAIDQLGDKTLQADAAYRIFGRNGVKLLNLFRMGENGIAEIQARMEKWGATFDRIDAAKVERANDAIANAQATARVFGNTMAIEVAPIIEVSANKFTKWADEGVISAVKIQEGVRSVALNVAALTDRIDVVSGAWVELRRIGQEWFRDTIQTILLARQGFNHLKAGALDVQATLLSLSPVGSGDRVKHLRDMEQAANDGAKALHSLRTAMVRGANVEIDALKDRYLRLRIGPSWQQQTEKFFEDLDKATAKARENLEAMNGGGTGNIDIEGMVERMNEQAAAAQKVNDMLADIDRQIRTFGMSDMEMKLFDLKSIGATVEQIENARSKLMDLDRLQEQADRRARQEERASEIASIIRRLEDDARRIGLSERDKLALDLEALGAGDDKIIKALQLFDEAERRRKALKDPNDTSLSESPVLRLVRAGSAEADRLRFQSQNQQREKIPQQQLAEQKRTNKKLNRLDRIERAVEKLGEGQGWDID